MIDKLTKKRIRVNYCDMIVYLKLDKQFVLYMFSKRNHLSMRRLALAFLRKNKVDIDSVFYEMKEKGFHLDLNEQMLPVQQVYQFDDLLPEQDEFVDHSNDLLGK